MARYQSYIICTSPRSGSTLLCRLLAATEISGKPDSHFHSPCLSDWMGYYDISHESFANEHDLLLSIFEAARARGTGETGVFGLRMQRNSFDFFMRKLDVICSDGNSDSDVEKIQSVLGKTLFIHLTRDNKLDQAISLVKAAQTGLWHKAPDGTEIERTSKSRQPFYDADVITHHLAELTELDAQWKTWFAEQALEPLYIHYDELSADPTDVLARILGRLGVDRKIAKSIALPVARLADETNKLWAERFLSEQGTPG